MQLVVTLSVVFIMFQAQTCCYAEKLIVSSLEIPRGSSLSQPSGDSTNVTCGLSEFPPPVLSKCTEPILQGVPDLRGTWNSDDGMYMQRIEQCADRLTISGPGAGGLFYIHDFVRLDGTTENGCIDFNAGAFPKCVAINPAGTYNATCIFMKVGPIMGASRCLQTDGSLHFYNVAVGKTTVLLKEVPTTTTPTTTAKAAGAGTTTTTSALTTTSTPTPTPTPTSSGASLRSVFALCLACTSTAIMGVLA